MPITRTNMIDDDGSGTTGTILNNAWKQELYGQVDDVVNTIGAWTPVDTSGAGLVFQTPLGRFCLIGRVLYVWASLLYPTTSSGAPASIGGLPYANAIGFTSGFYQTYGVTHSFHMSQGGVSVFMLNPTSFAQRTNAEMSGQTITFAGAYLIP
jgi:hypothetical protein